MLDCNILYERERKDYYSDRANTGITGGGYKSVMYKITGSRKNEMPKKLMSQKLNCHKTEMTQKITVLVKSIIMDLVFLCINEHILICDPLLYFILVPLSS